MVGRHFVTGASRICSAALTSGTRGIIRVNQFLALNLQLRIVACYELPLVTNCRLTKNHKKNQNNNHNHNHNNHNNNHHNKIVIVIVIIIIIIMIIIIKS